jgi:hypothetical protein
VSAASPSLPLLLYSVLFGFRESLFWSSLYAYLAVVVEKRDLRTEAILVPGGHVRRIALRVKRRVMEDILEGFLYYM